MGKHHVCHLGGLCEEEVVHHEEVERLDALDDVADVGVCADLVFAEDEQALDLTGAGGVEDLGRPQALLLGELHSPRLFELGHDIRVGDLLVAGEVARGGAHVAGTLDVVLATQRVDAAAGAT